MTKLLLLKLRLLHRQGQAFHVFGLFIELLLKNGSMSQVLISLMMSFF